MIIKSSLLLNDWTHADFSACSWNKINWEKMYGSWLNPLRLHLQSPAVPIKYMQICKIDSWKSSNIKLQIVSYECDHGNITKLICLLYEAYCYMTQFQKASTCMVQFDLI